MHKYLIKDEHFAINKKKKDLKLDDILESFRCVYLRNCRDRKITSTFYQKILAETIDRKKKLHQNCMKNKSSIYTFQMM